MKSSLFFSLITITFITLVSVPESLAQEISTPGNQMVRLIYFLPRDRSPRPDRVKALRQLIKDAQQFYADEMEGHGFGRKTFTIETDITGEPLVLQVNGRSNDTHYHQDTINKVWQELRDTFGTSQRIHFVAIDISNERLDGGSCGAAKGYYEQRVKGFLMPASGHCFNLALAAHELGHAFALEHDFRDDAYIMSYGSNQNRISKCAAEWLDAHGFFNNTPAQVNRDAKIQMLAPTAAPPNGIRLRFEVAAAGGLHQAMLYLKPTLADPANDFKLDGCHVLDAESDTIEFVTSELVDPSQNEVTLQVIDKNGGMKRQTFPINFVHLLPPPTYVSVPDQNLAAAVRNALGLGTNAAITQQWMQGLTELDARKSQIKNLTGLEHATRLRSLELRENQIRDIRPLTNLKNLKELILDDNNVSDITPLTNMTQLTWL
ncbi:MAG: leucine-rich repeat domain-containing protein, partial [Candidatus Poribacteria bacterium]|nr:leucine-rich repeat domain-containing protein [Candidatus Poribacteria bacterium]